MTNYDEYYTTI